MAYQPAVSMTCHKGLCWLCRILACECPCGHPNRTYGDPFCPACDLNVNACTCELGPLDEDEP